MSSLSAARHPVGLYLLCTVELCERFAGSLFGSLLLLYLNERLGMAAGTATRLSGAFSGAVYGASVLGGFVADRFLGTRRAILLGAALLALGYAVLSTEHARALYPAAALLVLGHALFKPNLSAAIGKIYGRADRRREEAYSLYYIVFNVGAALGPMTGGALRAAYGWSTALSVAALAMLLALVVCGLSSRALAITDAVVDAAQPWNDQPKTATWKLSALASVVVAVLLFTTTYEQSGQSLLFWARDCTRRSLLGHTFSPSALLALPGVFVLAIQPMLSRLLSGLRQRGYEPSQLVRMQAGIVCSIVAYLLMTGAAMIQGQNKEMVRVWWLVGCFLSLTLGELLVYPVSLALITRMAPPHRTAFAAGVWMAAVAVGQGLAGELAACWTAWSHPAFFAMLAAISAGAVAVLTLVARWSADRGMRS